EGRINNKSKPRQWRFLFDVIFFRDLALQAQKSRFPLPKRSLSRRRRSNLVSCKFRTAQELK
ncbi:MAG: hypothetical protein WCD55_03005, partial [Bacteroidales bacterium]